jgi:hypothetical protein
MLTKSGKKKNSKIEIEHVPEVEAKKKIPNFQLGALVQVEIFLAVLITPGADLRIIKNANDGKANMKVFLLNPASIFSEISKDARAVLLAGGTMKPYQTLKDQLFAEVSSEKLSWFNCEHVISDSQMNALVLQRGPTNERFIFNHSNKDNLAMKQDLGRALGNGGMNSNFTVSCSLDPRLNFFLRFD